MRSLLLTLLLIAPLAAPAATAQTTFDAAALSMHDARNLVAGKERVYVWADVAWTGSYEGAVDVAVTLDGVIIGSAQQWVHGQRESVALQVTIPENASGDATLAFVLDPHGRLSETDEDNNAVAIPVFVHAAPFYDLAATSLSWPATASAGSPFEVVGTVTVTGEPDPIGRSSTDGTSFETVLLVDGERICCRMIAYVVAGEVQPPTWTVTLPEGWHSLEMLADWDNTSYEQDEGNNVLTTWVYVPREATPPEPADAPDATVELAIERPMLRTDLGALAPNPARRIAHVEACNEGTAAITRGALLVSLAAGARSRLLFGDEHALTGLAPGACRSFEIEYTPQEIGDHTVTAIVSAADETDTENNAARVKDFFFVGGAGGLAL